MESGVKWLLGFAPNVKLNVLVTDFAIQFLRLFLIAHPTWYYLLVDKRSRLLLCIFKQRQIARYCAELIRFLHSGIDVFDRNKTLTAYPSYSLRSSVTQKNASYATCKLLKMYMRGITSLLYAVCHTVHIYITYLF